jgi:hypothetical protein
VYVAAREFGLARKTVSKLLRYSAPPCFQRHWPVRQPKLGPWQGAIDAIFEDDKQRYRAKRTFDAVPDTAGKEDQSDGPSLGRLIGSCRWYPGATAYCNIFRTLSRDRPKSLATAR